MFKVVMAKTFTTTKVYNIAATVNENKAIGNLRSKYIVGLNWRDNKAISCVH